MIHWLTQSHTELPSPLKVKESARYLNEEEQARYLMLKTRKRRNDWLLGRWTAKRLLQTVIWEKDGITLPLDMITIRNNKDGAPDYHSPLTNRRFSISISHSHEHAFVAVIEKPDVPVGADIELIQARPKGFAETYFTLAEICLGNDLTGQERALWETAAWSAKESVLKALHLGLSVDTRAVSCLIEPVTRLPQTWIPFAVKCDDGRLPQPALPLNGWWRVDGNFVLTIAVGV